MAALAGQPVRLPRPAKQPAGEADWRQDERWAQDLRIAIEWREDWDKTVGACREKWTKELSSNRTREPRIRGRYIAMFEALIQKYPDDAPRLAEAHRQIAEHLRYMGYPQAAGESLRRAMEAAPGRTDVIVSVLWGPVRSPEEWPTEIVEQSARRIQALNRVGSLPDTDPMVIESWRALAIAFRRQGRFMEAAEALEMHQRLAGPTPFARNEEANLFTAAGHVDEALPRWEAIAAEMDHPDRNRDLRNRMGRLAAGQLLSVGRFAGQETLSIRWSILRLRPPTDLAADFLPLIEEDPAGRHVVPWDDARYGSLWSGVDRYLREAGEPALQPVRAAQQAKATAAAETALRSGDDAALLQLFRRYPWAQASHGPMLELGQRLLRRGQIDLARRTFEDVLNHSADAQVRQRAQAGIALAQREPAVAPEPASVEAWSEVRIPAINAWPASLLQRIPAELARTLPWTGANLHVAEGKIIAAGPAMLACFGQNLGKPLWVQSSQWPGGNATPETTRRRFFTMPGVIQPAVADGRIFARWGVDPATGYPTSIASFDLETGRMIWSSRNVPELAALWPIGDPAVGEGRLYYAAAADAASTTASGTPVFIACVDAASGKPLWVRRLADLSDALLIHTDGSRRRAEDERDNWRADLARYGNAVTVADGAVYVLTNMGVAARLDARDGVIEWAATYSRPMLTWDSSHILRRLGSAPIVAGELLILAPRDYYGLFALNRETGKTAWSRPFAPSAKVVGQCEGLLLLADEQDLVALHVESGDVAWMRRVSDGDARKAVLRGHQVWVDGGSQLSIFDARNGATLGMSPLEGEPIRQFVFRGSEFIALTDRLAPAPAAAASSAVQGRAWHLRGAQPRLHLAPERSKLSAVGFVTSGQVLSAVDAAGKVLWQRMTRPDLESIRFADDRLLLVYGQQVQCIDGMSGQLRWERPTPIFIDQAAVAGNHLVAVDGDARRAPSALGIDVNTGLITWHRAAMGAPDMERLESLLTLAVEGEHVHLIGRSSSFGGLANVLCRAADGVVLSGRGIANAGRENRRFTIDGLLGVALSDGGVLSFFTLQANAQPEQGQMELGPRAAETVRELAVRGPWAYLRLRDGRQDVVRTLILKRGEPAYRLQRDEPGVIRGDRLYEFSGRTLTVIDLPSRRTIVQCVAPVPESIDHHTRILDFWEEGPTITIVSGMERGPSAARQAGDLRVDRFDLKTGGHLHGRALPEAFWQAHLPGIRNEEDVLRHAQSARLGMVLVVSSAEGVSGYGLENAPADALASVLVCREGKAPLASAATPGILVSHDDERLYIRVAYPDAQVEPWHGGTEFSGGDWLQLALTTNVTTIHLGVGLDAQGRAVVRKLSGPSLPAGIEAEVQHDLTRGHHTYLLTIPLKRLVHRDGQDRWRNIGLSLVAWDSVGLGSPQVAARLGDGVRGAQVLAQHHQPLHLYPLSLQEEQSAMALAGQLPHMETSRRFMERAGVARSPQDAVAFYSAYLKQNPSGPITERVLLWIDRAVRRDMADDAAARVLKIAADAGVPEAIRQRYAAIARAYLSQWVWIDPSRPPRMIMLQLNDGSSWEHRISFGQFQAIWTGALDTPSRRHVGMPPAGQWQELRIPLIWLDMHDKPIHGLLFGQHGGARVFWDRTAIVAGGKEQVLIEDQTPEGQAGGFWDWTTERFKSGRKSHTYISPVTDDEATWHDISAMTTPGAIHLAPPPAAPAHDSAAAIAALEQAIPKLGPGDLAIKYLQEMLAMQGDNPQRRVDRMKWFLRTLPMHPGNGRILADLLELARETNQPDPAAFVDAIITECKTPLRTRYAFRRTHTHTERAFLQEWQVVGPFANINDRGLEFPYPPEVERTRLEAEYRGAVEMVKWKRLQSDREYINLLGQFVPNQHAVAYAVCWVRSDKARPVMLEIGSDDGSKVWINRRLVHAQHEHDYAERGNWRVPAYLSAGWNEILVKVEQAEEEWGFYLELVDPEGRGGLKDLTVRSVAP